MLGWEESVFQLNGLIWAEFLKDANFIHALHCDFVLVILNRYG